VPKADFFQRLGLFAIDGFLDHATCREIRTAFKRGSSRAGTVGTKGSDFVVDRAYRSVNWVKIDETVDRLVRTKLKEAIAEVGRHYGLELTDCEAPQFLSYVTGDHYKAHRDSGAHDHATETSKVRRISSVIFLNEASEAASDETYGGGSLTFYGLFGDAGGTSIGVPLEPEEGLLITFPSEMMHSVEPVTHGERYTIASWFH
jgi:SM-20-related protein